MVNENEVIKGLSNEEAKRRNKLYGLNELEKKKKISALKIFLSQFNDFIIWVLIAATLISGYMGEKADAITIIIIVIMNAVLGFAQEYKTEKSLEALKKLTAPTSKVIRNGNSQVINAEYITIDDIIILESGDRIPADAELIESSNFLCDESLLTGESTGVVKDIKRRKIYMGAVVLTGRGIARVKNIGMHTEMGKIAGMLNDISAEKSPLKEKLEHFGKILVVLCLGICFAVTIMGIIRGENVYDMFLLGVSLAVAAIPEGLTAIVTVSLALGVSRMLKRNALVRKLPAVETLGCTSIICTDKTGTLTQNDMTVKAVFVDGKFYDLNKEKMPDNIFLKKNFTYCNDINYDSRKKSLSEALSGDPTETALVKSFFSDKKKFEGMYYNIKRIYEIPFDSDRKMMSVIVRDNGKKVCYVKGAPEKIINRCKYYIENGKIKEMNFFYKKKVLGSIYKMTDTALRCIGSAYKENTSSNIDSMEQDLIFIGTAGMIDPPRKGVHNAILKCKNAGIKPVMITGDHKKTAFAIGKQLNICDSEDQIMTGDEIDKYSDKEFYKKVNNITVFARVNPHHKLRIVRAFKKNNNVVAMTGDGVNDAPAVKEADIGISMGLSGTDVTKEASAMILLDDNFSTIVAACEEGRGIYTNIRKFIRYLLSCNLGEVLTMFLSSLFYLETPLLPIQILLVNLATDGLPALALGVDPHEDDIMQEKPRKRNESIFANGLFEKIIIRGSLIGVCTILTFIVASKLGMDIKKCRTLTLGTLIMSQLIHVFECRSEKHSIFDINIFTNLYLIGAVLISITMLLLVIYVPFLENVFHTVPINIKEWAIVVFFSGIISFINSIYLLSNK